MKLVIIRHGDPDYAHDALTEKGKKEAGLLAEYFPRLSPAAVYCSPMGRAQMTMNACREKCGFTVETLPWLREFPAAVFSPTKKKTSLAWDQMPSFFTRRPLLYDSERWCEDVLLANTNFMEKYEWVRQGLDMLLEKHGYRHNGKLYDAIFPNRDTVVLFCHFGVLGVIMSILTGVSPYIYWQHFCALPTSITTLATEEREQGKAVWRCIGFGDLSHLALGGEEPSFAARFCETFDSDEIH